MMKSRKQNQPLVIPTGYWTLVKSEKKSKYALKQRRQISRVQDAECRKNYLKTGLTQVIRIMNPLNIREKVEICQSKTKISAKFWAQDAAKIAWKIRENCKQFWQVTAMVDSYTHILTWPSCQPAPCPGPRGGSSSGRWYDPAPASCPPSHTSSSTPDITTKNKR